MIKVPFRSSSCIKSLYVSPLRGIAIAQYWSGGTYSYKNVSRRAITNLMLNPLISMGFWTNRNLKCARTQYMQRPIG